MSAAKHLFQRALSADSERLHFEAHSHHPWPDATRAAQLEAWDLAATKLDVKWDTIFGDVYPACQRHVAATLGLPDPATLAFGPNTHELVYRVLSSLPVDRPIRVLSTGAEFHSFRRQMERLVEAERAEWSVVPAEPFDTLAERFAGQLDRGPYDLVFASHVLFDSGWVFEEGPQLLASSAESGALAILDGYHSYMAVPYDHGPWADRVFYTAGAYKYAMSGEGACFLHCPPECVPRPVFTGWFAGFEGLAGPRGGVAYPRHAGRFLGSTFDPTALFRLRATYDTLAAEGLSLQRIHAHALALQDRFLAAFKGDRLGPLRWSELIPPPSGYDARMRARARFLTFRRPDAGALQRRLLDAGVVTDSREDRLRFGFGIYQDTDDVERLVSRLGAL